MLADASAQDLSKLDISQLEALVEPIAISSQSSQARFANWADTFECRPQKVYEPTSIEECRFIVELARRQNARIHPVGVGHSPSDLACTNGWLVKMGQLKGLIKVDHEKRSASFYAGTVLHDIHRELGAAQPPMAMPNIGSISDQTIGGLISTASHGSGVTYPVCSKHVRAITLVLPLPGAPIIRCTENNDPDLFKASLCGLGATGLMVEVEFEVEEAFRLRETKEPHTIDEVLGHLDELKASAEHVRLWWYPDAGGVVVGRANRTYGPPQSTPSLMAHFLGFHVTQFFLFLARLFPTLTPLVGRWAWWLANEDSVNVDDGHKVLNFDCLFPQYALEWALPSDKAEECLREMREWLAREAADPTGLRVHFPVEIRWSAPDDVWLSPSYGRETTWIGVVTYRPYGLPVPYRKFQGRFADILESHGARPHWAKEHRLKPKAIQALYPKFADYRRVLERVDPDRIMRSEYVRRHIDGEDIPNRIFKKRNAEV